MAKSNKKPAGAVRQRQGYTTFVLWPDQIVALKLVAVRMQAARGGGKADASEVLRLTLDAVATGGELPEGVREALAAGMKERARRK